ncbi:MULTISPECIES: hypothetical protein [unclassified Nostoc]|uniref:hypothetical protein n=1 Tax=unclassified Nostoc TaxID=2593658 RepID=UPI0025EBE168|nr:hypothetical protein [Nostoc sp. JL31]
MTDSLDEAASCEAPASSREFPILEIAKMLEIVGIPISDRKARNWMACPHSSKATS